MEHPLAMDIQASVLVLAVVPQIEWRGDGMTDLRPAAIHLS